MYVVFACTSSVLISLTSHPFCLDNDIVDQHQCLWAAGEAEYVAFAEECSCDGPVESWLQNVVDAMRAALSHEFKVAIPAYDEKPRTKWIFDYSVQNTIMVSRTFFTQDVNEAFEELEEGNEDALKVCGSAAPVL